MYRGTGETNLCVVSADSVSPAASTLWSSFDIGLRLDAKTLIMSHIPEANLRSRDSPIRGSKFAQKFPKDFFLELFYFELKLLHDHLGLNYFVEN